MIVKINTQIYEFASSAGAFEGYVYHKKTADDLDLEALADWAEHILAAYQLLPEAELGQIQAHCDQTLGRAIKSLIPVLGVSHDIVKKIASMIVGDIPKHADDFQKTKWFETGN